MALKGVESVEACSLQSGFKGTNLDYCMPEKYSVSKEFIEQEYFANNKSQQEIADELGISQWVISHRMRRYRLKAKERTWKIHKRKYSVNDDFFDKINPTNGWVLGWLASDGFVVGKGQGLCFGIKVAKKDAS